MKIVLSFLFFLTFISCAVFEPNKFSENALNEQLLTTDRTPITLKEVLQKNIGKEKFIQLFATYCPVSQDSFYDVVKFQEENPEKAYIFLSVDHSYHDWKRGIENIAPKGEFYYIEKKGEGALAKFLKLKTIPRFLKIDTHQNIKVFKTSAVSSKLK